MKVEFNIEINGCNSFMGKMLAGGNELAQAFFDMLYRTLKLDENDKVDMENFRFRLMQGKGENPNEQQ